MTARTRIALAVAGVIVLIAAALLLTGGRNSSDQRAEKPPVRGSAGEAQRSRGSATGATADRVEAPATGEPT
ncbi:MAG: hypothetical protein WAP37_04360, partial [Solirubrobacterales bacterium]